MHRSQERPRGRRGRQPPLHGASCKATWMPQGCTGPQQGAGWVTLQGELDLLHLTRSSGALAAVSPEGEARFCLDSTALPWALAPPQPHLHPGPANSPTCKEEGPISH